MNNLRDWFEDLFVASYVPLQSHMRIGEDVFDYEWDCLIILDACRVDALCEVADDYSFLTNIESKLSIGSTSKEWLDNTFVEKNKKK